MKASISRAEINSLLQRQLKPGLLLVLARIENGEIGLDLKTKVLIKEVTVHLTLWNLEAHGSLIEARLKGLPEWLINFARNQGWLTMPGLKFDGERLHYDLSQTLPGFLEIESIAAEEDEIALTLRHR